MTTLLPAIYVSHGSPMLAIDPGPTGAAFDALGARLRALKPKAVLVISAHWIYSTLAVGTRTRQEAWHDFGGFPRELYALRYDAPGSPDLAARVKSLIEAAAIPGAGFVAEDEDRPLDHGAWMPLRHFFPDADVPVVQLAFNPYLSPATQIEIGRALAPLREEGVLVIGSGSFTHNLQEVFGGGARKAQHGPETEPYVDAFRGWMADALNEALATGDVSRIADYRTQAPFARRAHPTDEHLLPFYVTLGAAIGADATTGKDTSVTRVADEVTYGVLAMDTFVFDGIGTGHAPLPKAA